MNVRKISFAERDKLASGFGLVSDVLYYYPKGICFPVYVEDLMQNIILTPEGSGYKMTTSALLGKKKFIGVTLNDSFGDAIEKAKDLAFAALYGYDEEKIELTPQPI